MATQLGSSPRVPRRVAAARPSKAVDLDHRIGEGPRGLLVRLPSLFLRVDGEPVTGLAPSSEVALGEVPHQPVEAGRDDRGAGRREAAFMTCRTASSSLPSISTYQSPAP